MLLYITIGLLHQFYYNTTLPYTKWEEFFTCLHFPLASFPAAGIMAIALHDILWEAVTHLEHTVASWCSPHHRFCCIQQGTSTVPHKAVNVYSRDPWTLYFFSDAPHLVKGAIKCLSHSSYQRTRLLWVGVLMYSYLLHTCLYPCWYCHIYII